MVTTGAIGPSGPSAFSEASAGAELVQPAGAIEALYEQSGVHVASKDRCAVDKISVQTCPTVFLPPLVSSSLLLPKFGHFLVLFPWESAASTIMKVCLHCKNEKHMGLSFVCLHHTVH